MTVTPAFAERLPIPDGYHDAGAIFIYLSPLGRYLNVFRCEGDTSADAFYFIYQDIDPHVMNSAVQICYSSGGNVEHPRNLDELKVVLKELTIHRPLPDWLLQILDALHEFEVSPTVSRVRLRKVFSIS